MWQRWRRHLQSTTETRRTQTTTADEAERHGGCSEDKRKPRAKSGNRPRNRQRMVKKARPTKTSTGNALAQFMILSGLTVVAYQFIVTRLYASYDDTTGHGVSSSSPWSNAPPKKHRTDREAASTTEFSLFMACVGLFGLMQRKKKKQDEENAIIEAQRRSLEKQISRRKSTTARLDDDSSAPPSPVSSRSVTYGIFDQRPRDQVLALADDVQVALFTFLSAEDLVACALVNKAWSAAAGDDSELVWKTVFTRDFHESGDRFHGILPHVCWRQYYFLHQLSRAVEIARWLNETQERKCVVIEGMVYDVTTFMDSHPGGYHVLGDVLGTDASDVWEQFQHSEEAKELMKEYVVQDAALISRMEAKQRGDPEPKTLASVLQRWQQISWCLAHAHLLGAASHAFLELSFKFIVWRTAKRRPRSSTV